VNTPENKRNKGIRANGIIAKNPKKKEPCHVGMASLDNNYIILRPIPNKANI
jgi:hypothetical protein